RRYYERDIWQYNRGGANEVSRSICPYTSDTTKKTLCYFM
ncbi:hypothetical protein, partial [uncultured Gammaproteobacteria bacterium]